MEWHQDAAEQTNISPTVEVKKRRAAPASHCPAMSDEALSYEEDGIPTRQPELSTTVPVHDQQTANREASVVRYEPLLQ